MIRQLAFDLPNAEAMTRAQFFAAPSNALALAAVEGWRDWPGRKLLLVGPEGAGKTHLAHIWAALAGAVILSAETLPGTDIAGLAGRAVVVEDADQIGHGGSDAEVVLF
ncbi:MAG: chromosomal replication initiator DnaA, partial [Acetobacteraceae bacterium]